MQVVITGATGFIGRALAARLIERGDTVTALTRSTQSGASVLPATVRPMEWSPAAMDGAWVSAVNGADAVVNLAGEPIADKRWSKQQKAMILSSRLQATSAVVEAIKRVDSRPKVLINGSAIGYYGPRGDELLTEGSAPGPDFLAGVVRQWEGVGESAQVLGVRTAFVRTGIVLGTDGGALPRLLLPFKLYSGGVMGPVNQWVSWIHIEDEVRLILAALDDPQFSGPINFTAPNPVTMDVFSHAIGRVLHRPVWVPGLPMMMRLALGERSEVVFASQRVLPERAVALGFEFRHPDVREALQSLLGRG